MQVCGAGVWESERVLRCVAMRREGLEGGLETEGKWQRSAVDGVG
jgi:hypothetical protein